MELDKTFYEQADAWLERLLELNPVAATQLGDHRWDDRLGDTSMAAIESQNEEIRSALASFEALDTTEFRLAGRIDQTLLVQILKSFVRRFDKVQSHLRSPGEYLDEALGGVFVLIIKEFAPLSERLTSALGRVKEIPRVLADAQSNLVPERVPRVWAETAMEQANQAVGLFAGLLPALAAQVSPELQQDMAAAGQEAAQAVQAYVGFLENEVLPRAEGDFAVGKAYFDELLREEHMVDYDAEELLETGWQQLRLTRTQMEAVAKEIDPAKSVQELLEDAKADHPSADGVLEAYQQSMEAARRFIVEHDIVTIPEGESLRIIDTPEYLRPIIPYAAYMQPGILEEEQKGIFIVTPVDPEAPSEAQEQKLKGHNWAKLPVVALHEAYPGHHLQLVWANLQETIPRRMGTFLATLFIEGWAFYCEEMMEQMGFIATPIQRLGRLADQLWRAARIILDVSLHTGGMTVEEAIDFLVREAQLEPDNARAEVRRYTQTPTQPQSYLMGKLQIVKLVEDFRRANPELSLREVHDAILGCGSLPPRLLREQLFAA